MTDTGSETTPPGITVSVYRINPETLQRTPVHTRTLAPLDVPVFNLEFPPCECPRCRTAGASR
ncbi:hypothetical protein [Streptomyces sp. NPDC001508]|uniref:hypothetical protein n=1 Tax=Streptomyces sp. NPDC001508 TaxID=3154656 RepID=UPI003324B054